MEIYQLAAILFLLFYLALIALGVHLLMLIVRALKKFIAT